MDLIDGFHPQENPCHWRIEGLGEALKIGIAGCRRLIQPTIDLLTREGLFFAEPPDIGGAVRSLIADLGQPPGEAFANTGECTL